MKYPGALSSPPRHLAPIGFGLALWDLQCRSWTFFPPWHKILHTMNLRHLVQALSLLLAAAPAPALAEKFSLYFNSDAEGVISYEDCRQKTQKTLYFDCGGDVGIKMVIYASPSGACTNTPGSDAVILLSERTVSASSDCKGTLSIDPSDVVGDDCPCSSVSSLQLCAATKYQAYNYETLLLEWQEGETVSLALSYDSKPPTAPTLTSVESGDSALHLRFTGPSDIAEWEFCLEDTSGGGDSEEAAQGAAAEEAPDAGTSAADASDASSGSGESSSDEGTCDVGTSPFADMGCTKIVTISGTGKTSGTAKGLTNGTTYRVTLAGRDAAGNYSPVSDSIEATPMDVQDFFGAYTAAGGAEKGGFGCSSTEGGAGLLGWLAALLPLSMMPGALFRRRRNASQNSGRGEVCR